MTKSETPEPGVPASGGSTPDRWWRRPVTGIAVVLIGWFTLTWTMLSSTKNDVAAAEERLKSDIAVVENRLRDGITSVESRLKTDIDAAEDRLSDHLARVEGRLDRIMEILLDEARRADRREADGS